MDDYPENLTGADTEKKEAQAASLTVRVDEQESLTGTMLDGRYLVKRVLGQGGFGVVYLASDEKMLSRPVVVKCLHDAVTVNEWTLRKFKQEMEALARIDHPSIVGILDSGQLASGKPYIVMQYVAGVSLRLLITPEGMDFRRAANIFKQVGRALTAAHERGILHRDLKPENIMVQPAGDDEEHIKIIDFGIAKVKNSTVSSTSVGDRTVGTIAYMSPEQLSAGPVSTASDVYCFAVIAYELLTGKRPVNPESAYQLLELQRAGVRVKPVDLRPGLPEAAQAVILQGLSFDPKSRQQKARDFGDLLATALADDDDDEQTVLQAPREQLAEVSGPVSSRQTPELAHVLFIDIDGYAKMLIDEQSACLQKLQTIVGGTDDFARAQRSRHVIRLPMGDGLALVFFGEPEAPARCALEICRALKDAPEMRLRMGIHSGLVSRTSDINTSLNVAGGGIKLAQLVMECGDAGHILVSKRVADDLGQLARWAGELHDLGEVEVKQGARLHLFNLYDDEFGNSATPAKLLPPGTGFPAKRTAIAATVVVIILIGVGAFVALRPRGSQAPATTAIGAPPVREQSLTYWLTVQKMVNGKLTGDPFASAGQEIFGNGWRFFFNLEPGQNGALYLINEGPGADNRTEYNALFPNPGNNKGVAGLAANQKLDAGPFLFLDQTGVEKIWLIWTSASAADLDAIFRDAANHGGVIKDAAQIATVQNYLKQYDSGRPEVVPNKAAKRTLVKAKGDIVVNLIELSHEAY